MLANSRPRFSIETESGKGNPSNVDEAGNCGGESVSGLCRISYTYSREKRAYLRDFGTQFSGSHVSGLANSECLSALSNPYINQCSYDCGWEGWGN